MSRENLSYSAVGFIKRWVLLTGVLLTYVYCVYKSHRLVWTHKAVPEPHCSSVEYIHLSVISGNPYLFPEFRSK